MDFPDELVMGLAELALNKWSLFLAGGIFILTRGLEEIEPVRRYAITRAVLSFVPEGLGIAAALFGGIPMVAGQPLALQIAAGLWCAFLAENVMGKVFDQIKKAFDRGPKAESKPDPEVAAALASPSATLIPGGAPASELPLTADIPATVLARVSLDRSAHPRMRDESAWIEGATIKDGQYPTMSRRRPGAAFAP